MNLTIQEINQLLVAVRSWEKEPGQNAVVKAMLGGLGREGKDREAQLERDLDKMEQDLAVRRDESVLLQAKLIAMRNELSQAEFLRTEKE